MTRVERLLHEANICAHFSIVRTALNLQLAGETLPPGKGLQYAAHLLDEEAARRCIKRIRKEDLRHAV